MTAEVSGPPEIAGCTFVGVAARGGWSDVFLYEQHLPRRRVAVKVMSRSSAAGDLTVEANVLARLGDHPSIVAILQAGVTDDGRPYVVMPYLPGSDLGTLVREEGPLSVVETVAHGVRIASALETLRRQGILHRDVKPSNIMLNAYGLPVLIDFGTALVRGDQPETEPDISLPWAAPEIIAGSSAGSPSSDVYSLAATLYTLLTGRPPFGVPGVNEGLPEQVTRVLTGSLEPIGRSDVPPKLERLLRVAMSPAPDQRPQNALELARALQEIELELGLQRTAITVLDHEVSTPSNAAAAAADGPEWTTTVSRSRFPRERGWADTVIHPRRSVDDSE